MSFDVRHKMEHAILEPSLPPRGSKVASAPARKLAESLAEELTAIGKVYYGVRERDGAGWELAVSIRSLHYVIVLSYVAETGSFYLRYEPSLFSSLLFWWRAFSARPHLRSRIQSWSAGQKDLSSIRFVSQKELLQFERDKIAEQDAAMKNQRESE